MKRCCCRHAITLAACSLVFFTPLSAWAAILINEIAWMGTATSANDEWIELRNTGADAVSLDGWMLTDSAGSLTIELSGTLGAGAYGVLERTNDDSAPGVAFLIYTGSLLNSGVTLTLTRDGGGTEDQVAGGEDWVEVGGDNATKETAQLTSGGWVTAVATPGAENSSEDSLGDATQGDEEEESGEEAGVDSAPASTESNSDNDRVARVRIFADDPLKLSLSHLARGFVGQPVRFSTVPSGLEETKLRTLSYRWSFGDGTTSDRRTPLHTYDHAGTYVVVAIASRANHEAAARSTITVLPLSVSLSRDSEGDLLIHNDAQYEIDVSGLILSDDAVSFTLPEHTYIPRNGTLALSPDMTGFAGAWSRAALRYPTGGTLARYPAPQEPETFAGVTEERAPSAVEPPVVGGTSGTEGDSEADVPPDPERASPVSPAAAAAAGSTRERYASAAFAALMAVSVLALYLHRFV